MWYWVPECPPRESPWVYNPRCFPTKALPMVQAQITEFDIDDDGNWIAKVPCELKGVVLATQLDPLDPLLGHLIIYEWEEYFKYKELALHPLA